MNFENGEKVTWFSQAGGNTRQKTGYIYAEVPARTDAGDLIRAAEVAGTHRSTYGGGIPRNHTSYLVVVPAKTSKGKPILYWPVTSKLKRAV